MAGKGKVFLDGGNRPYLIREWGDDNKLWLFYWHPESHWTSLREVQEGDTFPNNLTQEEQDVYHGQHEKWEDSLPI